MSKKLEVQLNFTFFSFIFLSDGSFSKSDVYLPVYVFQARSPGAKG